MPSQKPVIVFAHGNSFPGSTYNVLLNDLRLRLYGDKGGLEVQFEKQVSRLFACLEPNLKSAEWTEVPCPDVPRIYDRFIAAIRGEGLAEPDFARGAALQRLLDRAEASAQEGGRLLQV